MYVNYEMCDGGAREWYFPLLRKEYASCSFKRKADVFRINEEVSCDK
jgi:hypothetical protein